MKVYTYMVIGKRVYEWTEVHETPEKVLADFVEKIMCFEDGCQMMINVYTVDKDYCRDLGNAVCSLVAELKVDRITVVEVDAKTWAGPKGSVKLLIAIV